MIEQAHKTFCDARETLLCAVFDEMIKPVADRY